MFCIGVSSSGQILLFGIIRDKLDSNTVAIAFSINNMFICFGNAIFQLLASYLLDFHKHFYQHIDIKLTNITYNISDYRFMLLIMPCAYFLVLIIFLAKKLLHFNN